ncbi:hypothetical protein XELAEV_18035842mg [Xenopus laevis]|uniref:CHCH domain-containing protein n=1 Tax=Xenopus laevis TaxID=8355 RepID=A0A974CGA5_XENLA|nr:hypothetical protein XELAEV_18035842mg [Xenopus laevis]
MSDSVKEGPAETVAEVEAKPTESPCAELKIAMEKCVAEKGEDSCHELIQAYKDCERVLRGARVLSPYAPIILSSPNPTIPLGRTDGVVLLYMINAVGCISAACVTPGSTLYQLCALLSQENMLFT